MLHRVLAIVFLLAATLPGTAHACMARDLETYMLLDGQPPVPDGAVTLRVRVSSNERNAISARATVLEAAPAILGAQVIVISAQEWTSCSRWGLLDAPAYVVGYLRRNADDTWVMQVIQNRWTHDPRYPRAPGQRAPVEIMDRDRGTGNDELAPGATLKALVRLALRKAAK
jgi:hypothetical protein